MTTLKEEVLKKINGLKEQNTIYVLKGFNYWLNFIDNRFLFTKEPIIGNNSDLISNIALKLGSKKPWFALHEDITWLNNNSLAGLIAFHGYKVVIIVNDLYHIYYPTGRLNSENHKLQELHTKDTDNIVQQYYGEMSEIGDICYVAYNDLLKNDYSEIKISELLKDSKIEALTEKVIEIPEEYNLVSLSGLITQVIEENFGNINVLVDKINIDLNVLNIKKILEPIGIKFTTREYEAIQNDRKINKVDYRKILQRKNASYDFRDIKIYKDPYEGSELIDVNQVEIIDDIVDNAMKALNSVPFRDVFTTAPTGAGKSIMFQIPAIYLAEKYDLLTIVVTPLIGLMNDQVNNIRSMTDKAATINSDYTPIEKENTLNRVKSGEVSILYLSPESLLSNSDIVNLIGDRKIGLIVVDEAHIVATWGKSFRPDYWYLGEFIHRLRNNPKTKYKFPIATFTATATFGGDENMYQDIIESLKMTPKKYIGNVKRNNIEFNVRYYKKDHAYQEEKLQVAIESINKLSEGNEKTLVYVPYRRHISDIYRKMSHPEKVGKYSGDMMASEKNETLNSIKNGSKNVVLATKAFGMGIDIDDIKNVYHFAPTGNVADYVQEVGRAARKSDMVGIASTDFFKEDFRYINQLYGMSSIKNYQVKAVLQKIYELYIKYNKRNFLISPDEFSYIFADQEHLNDVDSKLKTTLLIIKKDFEMDAKLNYVPLIFKPRSMFTVGYFMINDDFIADLRSRDLMRFFKRMELPRTTQEIGSNGSIVTSISPGDTYQLDFKSIWENRYRDMSFGTFKHGFYLNELEDFNFKIGEKILSRVIIQIDSGQRSLGEVKSDLLSFLDIIKDIFDDLRQSGKYFSAEEFSKHILNRHGVSKKHISDMISSSFIHLLSRFNMGDNLILNQKFFEYNSKTDKYIIKNISYERRLYRLRKTIQRMFSNERVNKSIEYTDKSFDSKEIVVGQLIELLEIAECNILSGTNPEFFVRVNNPYAIEKIINNPSYTSHTTMLVGKKHKESCDLMTYFFEKLNSNEERWNFIEKYFLGQLGKLENKN